MKLSQSFGTKLMQKSRAQKTFKLDPVRRGGNSTERINGKLTVSSDVGSNDYEEAQYTTLPETREKSFRRRSEISNHCRSFLLLCEKQNEQECITILQLLDTNFSVLKQFLREFRNIEDMCQRLKEKAKTIASYSELEKIPLACQNSISYTFYTSDATKVLRDRISECFRHKTFYHNH